MTGAEIRERYLAYFEERKGTALTHVKNPDDFALRYKGIASTSDGTWDDFEKEESSDDEDLSIDESDDELKIERF